MPLRRSRVGGLAFCVAVVSVTALGLLPVLGGCEAVLGLGNDTNLPDDANAPGQDGAPPATGADGNVGPTTDGASPGTDGPATDGPAPGTDGGTDGSPGDAACADADLTSSGTNCGRCGHDCGGGICQNSVCQPSTLVDTIDTPTGFAVDPNGIYFAVDGVLKTCPLSGCSHDEQQLASLTGMTLVATANGSVAFAGDEPNAGLAEPAVYTCPTSGCPDAALPPNIPPGCLAHGINATPGSLVGAAADIYVHYYCPASAAPPVAMNYITRCLNVANGACAQTLTFQATTPATVSPVLPIAADDARVYYVASDQADGGLSLASSDKANAGCEAGLCPTSFFSLDQQPSLLLVYAGIAYFATPAPDPRYCAGSNQCGPIFSCPTSGCTTPTVVTRLGSSVGGLSANPSGLYFTNGSTVGACPLSGCGAAGTVSIAEAQSSPSFVVASNGFVYWVNSGTASADGGFTSGTASIVRVAEP